MPAHTDHYTNILRFWRSVETFNLPDIGRTRADSFELPLHPGNPLPWENRQFPAPAEGRRWKHTLYFNLVKKEKIVAQLAKGAASTGYREPVSGITCLSALVVDQNGRPGARSYAPAAFVYAMKLIREKHSPEELTEQLKTAQENWESRFGIHPEEEPAPLTWTVLKKELAYLRRITANTLPADIPVLCISEQVHPASTLEAPFLNSYYIQDLDTLIRHPRDLGRPLRQLLVPEIDPATRKDLLDPHLLLQHLHPKHLPPGRWPANPAHGLYSAQLAALNITLAADDSGLLGINGPPGTGKTTLLREIIADVIVTRAKRLLNARVDNLFSGHRHSIGEYANYYEIDTGIFGADGIVVASNNNTAIENISKELPLLTGIDIDSFPEAEYFSLISTAIHGIPSWGLVSAALGKSGNRAAFVDKFWFNKDRSFNKHLRDLSDEADSAIDNFKAVADELKSLLQEYERFQKLAIAHHNAVLGSQTHHVPHAPLTSDDTGHLLTSEYGIRPQNLPGPDFTRLPAGVIHRLTPYSSEKINTLRSNIFLRSLELQEWAIRANPRYFQANLSTFIDHLANKHRDKITADIAATLWNTFFFCIPVVSVTLASFTRQFSKLGMASIGWLLLDEAGQATLPSVCGALWRSKRSILIGDTLQIPPVVTIPEALDRLLQSAFNINDDTWSPVRQSAQSLADRVTDTGAWLNGPGSSWIGIPLRAHRRCDEPMFSIANTIAYNGQMVQASSTTDDREAPTANPEAPPPGSAPEAPPANPEALPPGSAPEAPTANPEAPPPGSAPAPSAGPAPTMPAAAPPSTWIDVEGYTNDGHTIAEELDAVEELLQPLINYPGKIFIISPFRTTAEACRERFDQPNKIECGTIHTFQGKEAETVILVLGTLPAGKKARQWVAATPNILNVAVTRARHRLYVIGNRKVWSAHRYFDHLAKSLPSRPHRPQSPGYSPNPPDRS